MNGDLQRLKKQQLNYRVIRGNSEAEIAGMYSHVLNPEEKKGSGKRKEIVAVDKPLK